MQELVVEYMLKLNRTRTEYRVRMYWYPCLGEKNGVLIYEPRGRMFHCSFNISQNISEVNDGQGIKFKSLELETDASYNFKINDKITYLKRVDKRGNIVENEYRVTGVSVDNNSITGSDYTNKPSSLIKYISIEG
jgi:hypothetical protein